MNPYDFVPIDFNQPIARRSPILHRKFERNTVSGNLTGRIIAETPIFIKSGNSEQFTKNKAGQYIIPGTSLKGLFRNIVETVADGCFGGKCDRRYKDNQRGIIDHSKKIPASFLACTDAEHLCIACRIFGMLYSSNVFAGKVSFEDAVCSIPKPHPAIYTVDLMGPKPHHTAFYLDSSGNRIAGRKFYFHHSQGIRTTKNKTSYNQRITPLDRGSEFTFSAGFTNLETDEWQALLYAIVLEPEMRHKIGYAKPSGLGSVKIEITHIRLIDYASRYSSPNRGISEYREQALSDYIDQQIRFFADNRTSQTLNEFRRIWRWDVNAPMRYQYPTQDWFKNNPNLPISQTP